MKSFSCELPSFGELEKRLPEWHSGVDKNRLNVDGPQKVLEFLGHPQDKPKAIHVAGTNGKGTVCAILTAALFESGYSVAQFVSPHLHDLTERLILNGKPVTAERLDKALSKVLTSEESAGVKLSYFELIVISSFLVCAEEDIEWIVVEVGLGGRLDATNVLTKPEATAITSISLDHTAVLGNSEREIAAEKAGIFKKGVSAFIGQVSEDALLSIQRSAELTGAPLMVQGRDFEVDLKGLVKSRNWQLQLPVKNRGLFASYQLQNYGLAAYILHSIGITDANISQGMQRMRWPGRLELIKYQNRSILLDGAHNPAGINGLLEYLSESPWTQFHFLISILGTKDYSTILSILKDFGHSEFSFCKMSHETGMAPEILKDKFGGGNIHLSAQEALDVIVSNLPPQALLVVTGSLYFIGEVRQKVSSSEFETIAQI